MIGKIVLFLILFSSIAFAYNYYVSNQDTGEVVCSCYTSIHNGYLFFKPEYQPKYVSYFRPDIQLAKLCNVPIEEVRCE